jgi:two-component system phosphate regulon sensor histidine kinase PhoR
MLGIKMPQDINQPITFIFRDNTFIKLLESGNYENKKEVLIKSKNLKINIIDFGKFQKIILCQDQTSEVEIEKKRKIFISDISHELKTPLTIIQGYAEMLNEDKSIANKSATKLILEQSKHMSSIINDLLTLTKNFFQN